MEKRKLELLALIAFSQGRDYNAEVLTECLFSLSEAVVSIHYSGYWDREEMVSVGVEKALSLLKEPYFEPSKNIRGFLYTGIRNEVGNYLRRNSRTLPVSPESDRLGVVQAPDDKVLLEVEYQTQRDRILGRLHIYGITDDRYRHTVRNAALYRAVC